MKLNILLLFVVAKESFLGSFGSLHVNAQPFCKDLTLPATCGTADPKPDCLPSRSPDFCPLDQSFSTLIKKRTTQYRNDPSGTEADGYWFHFLEDKAASYMFSANGGIRTPEVYCCFTDPSDLTDSGVCPYNPGTPIVVKASDKHSNIGIYVFPNGLGSNEVLSGDFMTADDVVDTLINLDPSPSKIIVEEYVSGRAGAPLPIEYKLHMFGMEVGSIDIIANRGTDCACYAVVDSEWDRLDKYGCFEPTGIERSHGGGGGLSCHEIDFARGLRRAGPVKRDLPLCGDLPWIDPCVRRSMIEVAQIMSNQIGVYMRIDMFVDGNDEIFVQEYSPNHMGGFRHCAAREDPLTGCVDSCFLGALWSSIGSSDGPYGGPPIPLPPLLNGGGVLFENWSSLNDEEQCTQMTSTPLNVLYTPICAPTTRPPTGSPTVPVPTPNPTTNIDRTTPSPTAAPIVPLPRPTSSPVRAGPPTVDPMCIAGFTPLLAALQTRFTSFSPSSAPSIIGLNTNELRWGVAGTSRGQSGVRMDPVGAVPFTLVADMEFSLGTLLHFNNAIYNFDGIDRVRMTMDVQMILVSPIGTTQTVSFPFELTLDETKNDAVPCPYGDANPCADRLTFPLRSVSRTFTMDGITFGLQISGFFQNSRMVDAFISDESLTNAATLYAEMMVLGCDVVPLPSPPSERCVADFTPMLKGMDMFFTDFKPADAPELSGLNTEQLLWGRAGTASGQSGVRMDAAFGSSNQQSGFQFALVDNGEFVLGTLSHFNRGIYFFPGISMVTMKLNAGLIIQTPSGQVATVTFPFQLTLDETQNSANPCPYGDTPPCADRLTFPLDTVSRTFTLDGVTFGIEISGFFENGNKVAAFISDEDRTNQAVLLAKFRILGC